MSSISIQTKKINELDEALAVGSDNDLLVLRLADGTGTKAITVGALRKALAGDISALETEDKESVVAAVNEIVERLAKDEESLDPLSYDSAGAHNAIYRGKNLGTAFSLIYWIQNMGMMIVPIFIGRIFKNTITESGNALQEVSAAIQAEYVFVLLGIVSIVVAILLSVSSRRHPELCLDDPAV